MGGYHPQLLETKCPIISTGYTEWDMQRDWEWVQKTCGGEVDMLMEPGENIFRSLRWDLNDLDPADISCGNWGSGPSGASATRPGRSINRTDGGLANPV